MLAADVIGFAESRLCKRNDNVQFALKRIRLIKLDDTEKESVNRPHHGLALYIRVCSGSESSQIALPVM